ncbi:MAG: SusC/RagA family TonB-linked outer membrane protein [Ferruginibacter sp.]|nr:SusC/RagA family TonB-linked outer membrane protein [Cytophagales bacterium]
MKKILLISSLLALVFVGRTHAQDRAVTGKVTAFEDQSALPGVSVVVKGTSNGTATGADGSYRLTAPANATLVFSFIGLLAQEVEVGDRTTIDVRMRADVQQLGEVVVTALGIERSKNELPYAAQQVSGNEITKSRSNNFVNALSGKVAGLDIRQNNTMGGSTNVVIRGYKSLTGNNQALYVIDGVPVANAVGNSGTTTNTGTGNANSGDQAAGRPGYDYGNPASDINPDDIESINVLKGAAATALYGSRAANGVIVITTKKGRKNSTNVTVNTGVVFGTIDKKTFATYQKQYGAGYGAVEDESPDGLFLYRDVNGDGQRDLVTLFADDASYGAKFDPNLLVYQWNSFDPFSPTYRQATPWVAAANDPSTFYETSVNSNHSIVVDGGGENATFKIGYTRNDETGVLPNSKITKNQFNVATSYSIAKNLTVAANINYSKITGLGRYGTGYSGLNPNQAFRQWSQANVDIKELEAAYNRNQQNITWNWTDPSNLVPIYTDNPYWTRYENYENDARSHYFGYTTLSWSPVEWFNVLGRVSLDGYDDIQEERIAVGSADPGQYSRYNRTYSETNFDLLLNFNKNISPIISFRGLLGSNLRRTNLASIYAVTNEGLVVPKLYSLSNSVNPITAPTENYQRVGVDGYFGSVTFGYRDMLFLDATARVDQSTTLPAGSNTYFYPALAGSFVFSKLLETTSPWLTLGKVRLNYAEVGSDAPALSVYNIYDKPTGLDGAPVFSLPSTRNNVNLKPERTRSIEAGVEAAFLDSRLGFDFSWYKTNTLDQILPVSVTAATGYTAKYVNAGEVENKGIEASVYVTPVSAGDFSWTVNLNFARNRNKVLSLYDNVRNILLLPPGITSLQGGITINAGIDEPYGILRGTDYVYTNGQKTVNADGYYLASPNTSIIGDPNPDWTGGINNTLKYKGLSLSFLIDMRTGGDIFSLDQWYGQGSGQYPNTAANNDLGNPSRNPISEGGGVILPGVKEDGAVNDIRVENFDGYVTPYGYPNNPPRKGYVYDGSYVKLRELALRYSFPSALVSKLRPFKGIDVSLIGRNLWIISKNLPYADPEDALSSGNIRGYQSGSYPTTRTYGFNVRFML